MALLLYSFSSLVPTWPSYLHLVFSTPKFPLRDFPGFWETLQRQVRWGNMGTGLRLAFPRGPSTVLQSSVPLRQLANGCGLLGGALFQARWLPLVGSHNSLRSEPMSQEGLTQHAWIHVPDGRDLSKSHHNLISYPLGACRFCSLYHPSPPSCFISLGDPLRGARPPVLPSRAEDYTAVATPRHFTSHTGASCAERRVTEVSLCPAPGS